MKSMNSNAEIAELSAEKQNVGVLCACLCDLCVSTLSSSFRLDSAFAGLAALPEIAVFAELSEDELQGLTQRGVVKIFRTSPGGREAMLSIETAPASVAEVPSISTIPGVRRRGSD
jgi:hypothetical protein